MKHRLTAALAALLVFLSAGAEAAFRFEVSYPASLEQGPLDGRVLLVVAKANEREPRFQVGRGLRSQPLFGVDVDGWKAGQPAVIDTATRGWPLEEAAFLLQRFLEGTKDPYYAGSFDVGRREPHCYSGTAEFPGQTSHQRVLPKMLERIVRTAPPGADLVSWRY